MTISCLDEARVYVAQHQKLDKERHYYWCELEGWRYISKTTDGLVLQIASAMAQNIQQRWRTRIGCNEWNT